MAGVGKDVAVRTVRILGITVDTVEPFVLGFGFR
jgi:hypothetical protein